LIQQPRYRTEIVSRAAKHHVLFSLGAVALAEVILATGSTEATIVVMSVTHILELFIQQSIRAGFCHPDATYDFEDLCDEDLSLQAMYWSNCYHSLSHRVMILENNRMIDRFQISVCNFITRMLFSDIC